MSDTAPIGHNSFVEDLEKVDPLIERIQKAHPDIFDAPADFELERMSLPREVKTEADEQAIRAFVAKVQKVNREAEKARKAEGDDYLRGKQKIDGAFNGVKSTLEAMAQRITERLTPYLNAKAAADTARREAEMQAARVEAAARAEEERIARAAEAEERRKHEEAQAAIRQATSDRQRVEAQEQARAAEAAAMEQRRRAEEAQEAAIASERQADTHAATLAGGAGVMSKTVGGGATSKLETYWDWSVTDMAQVRKSLGVLGGHFLEGEILAAVKRAVEASKGDQVPGVRADQRQRAAVSSRSAKPS